MKEILAELSKHPVSTPLLLTGTLVVARDIAHAKFKELIDQGKGVPQYLKDHPVYYAGPAKTPPGKPSGSFGPTTAGRMDSYVDLLQSHGASMVMIAKGNRSQQVTDACKKHGGFYLGSIGGPAAVLAEENIKKVECIDFPELGMEAVWKIRGRELPGLHPGGRQGERLLQEAGDVAAPARPRRAPPSPPAPVASSRPGPLRACGGSPAPGPRGPRVSAVHRRGRRGRAARRGDDPDCRRLHPDLQLGAGMVASPSTWMGPREESSAVIPRAGRVAPSCGSVAARPRRTAESQERAVRWTTASTIPVGRRRRPGGRCARTRSRGGCTCPRRTRARTGRAASGPRPRGRCRPAAPARPAAPPAARRRGRSRARQREAREHRPLEPGAERAERERRARVVGREDVERHRLPVGQRLEGPAQVAHPERVGDRVPGPEREDGHGQRGAPGRPDRARDEVHRPVAARGDRDLLLGDGRSARSAPASVATTTRRDVAAQAGARARMPRRLRRRAALARLGVHQEDEMRKAVGHGAPGVRPRLSSAAPDLQRFPGARVDPPAAVERGRHAVCAPPGGPVL